MRVPECTSRCPRKQGAPKLAEAQRRLVVRAARPLVLGFPDDGEYSLSRKMRCPQKSSRRPIPLHERYQSPACSSRTAPFLIQLAQRSCPSRCRLLSALVWYSNHSQVLPFFLPPDRPSAAPRRPVAFDPLLSPASASASQPSRLVLTCRFPACVPDQYAQPIHQRY